MTNPSPKTIDVDLAIVGAGVAGIAAAKTAQAAGLTFELLEASDRKGGRALTDNDSLGVIWDRGCHWLHQARENPFRTIADQLGFAYRTHNAEAHIWMGNRWANESERAERIETFEAIQAAGHTAARQGRDVSLGSAMPDTGRWAQLHRQLLRGLTGEDPDELSVIDDARFKDTGDDWPVEAGYGTLVATWAADMPVRLSCPVERITRGTDRVVLQTAEGRLTARRAIITASTNVLARGGIRFDPPLPVRLQENLHNVPLGGANKVALAFNRDVFGIGDGPAYAAHLTRAPRGFNFQLRPFDRDLAVGHLGGPLAREMEAEGADAMVALALENLVEMFGSKIRDHLKGAATTAWENAPWIHGGYSVCRPGHADARERLLEPIDDTLLLAGEACSLKAFGTANGAYESGVAAASRVAETLQPATR